MQTNVHEREEFLTVDELAAEWRQHRATIYRKVAAGESRPFDSAAGRPRCASRAASWRRFTRHRRWAMDSSAPDRRWVNDSSVESGRVFPSFPPADPCRARSGPGSGGQSIPGAARGGGAMNLVALYSQLAKRGAWPAVEAELRRRAFAEYRSGTVRQRFPSLERAWNRLVLLGYLLEKE